MSDTRSERRAAYVTVQAGIGAVFFTIWVITLLMVGEDDAVAAAIKVVPYVLVYLAGILSRYIPGVRSAAKRIWKEGRTL